MNKESCLIILDISKDLFENKKKKFTQAIQCITQLYAHFLLYYKKKDELGLLLINSENSHEQTNLELAIDLGSSNFKSIKRIKELYSSIKEPVESKGDIFNAL